MLLSASECFWVLLSASECFRLLLIASLIRCADVAFEAAAKAGEAPRPMQRVASGRAQVGGGGGAGGGGAGGGGGGEEGGGGGGGVDGGGGAVDGEDGGSGGEEGGESGEDGSGGGRCGGRSPSRAWAALKTAVVVRSPAAPHQPTTPDRDRWRPLLKVR